MHIKILGPGCGNCHTLEHCTREALTELGLTAEITAVTDYPTIAGYGVMNTPRPRHRRPRRPHRPRTHHRPHPGTAHIGVTGHDRIRRVQARPRSRPCQYRAGSPYRLSSHMS